MNRKLRTPVIAGNWKMNKNPDETVEFINELKPMVKDANCNIIVCTPFTDLYPAIKESRGSNINVGAENCHWEESGAFTGEVSPSSLNDMGVEYVILGHSERRLYFAETSDTVCKRLHTALHNYMKIIMCVGEQLDGREKGITDEVVRTQLKLGLYNVPKECMDKIIIAYEPVWAIGTGKTATSNQAEQVCKMIRDTIAELYDDEIAKHMTILYGGSMNGKNADELLSMPNIDGGLIGGASLNAKNFADIINIASSK